VGEGGKWGCTNEERDGGEDSIELGSGEFRSGEGFVEGRAEVCAVDLSSDCEHEGERRGTYFQDPSGVKEEV
jgi:hypothetical protein